MRRLMIGAFLAWLATSAGCGGEKKYSIAVEFPDQTARDRTSLVRVMLIVPGQDAGCAQLLDGTAAPKDTGYTVEDEISIGLPGAEGARPLEASEPGPRLFFAQAEDTDGVVILHGCTAVDAGRDDRV